VATAQIALWAKESCRNGGNKEPGRRTKINERKEELEGKGAFIDYTKAGQQVGELSKEKRKREKTRIQFVKIQFCYTIFNIDNILITLHPNFTSQKYMQKR